MEGAGSEGPLLGSNLDSHLIIHYVPRFSSLTKHNNSSIAKMDFDDAILVFSVREKVIIIACPATR